MSKLSIAIQHTPNRVDRRQWVQAMLRQLWSENRDVPISLIEDSQLEGCWPTYRRALEAAGKAPHHLVLQDDLELCKHFIRTVEAVIRARPRNVISLYSNAQSVLTARERGESWIEKAGVCGPSMIWPTELISEFLDWQDRHIDPDFEFDTVRVSMWLIKTSKRSFATVPSLTQHLGYASSTLGLNSPTKIAAWYVGEQDSALGIDWSLGLASPITDTTYIHPEWWDHFHE
jgi:hypothetical protein